MKFSYVTKICEYEAKENEERSINYLNVVLNKLMIYIEKQMEANPDSTMKDINDNIMEIVRTYLSDISSSQIRNNIVEYYLDNNKYSRKNNIDQVYDDLYRKDMAKKIDIINTDTEEMRFSFNMTENMKKLVMIAIQNIRREKAHLEEIEGLDLIIIDLAKKNSKERANYIKRLAQEEDELSEEDKKKLIQDLERSYRLFSQNEKELVKEEVKKYTTNARVQAKADCIKCIVKSIELLDKFGLLEYYTSNNNKAYEKIYIHSVNYTYEQVKEMLQEDNLKKLNIEELVVMSSFWANRVNKVVKELNKSLYIINHKELLKEEEKQEDKKTTTYFVSKEIMKNIDLKMNVIHKLYFELYEGIGENEPDKPIINIIKRVKQTSKKHEEEYKKYFDKIFPDSENSLTEDMLRSNVFENTRYNSYKVKSIHMQSLLTSLFNSNSKNIENFGYIQEPGNRKEILIGVDIKGFNMPYALHINKDLILDFLREAHGNTLFPIYKGAEDFRMGEHGILKAQILLPMTKQADGQIKQATEKLTPRDRYAKAVRHINYLRKDGKMPEHMMKCKQSKKGKKYYFECEYIDLESGEIKQKDEIIL